MPRHRSRVSDESTDMCSAVLAAGLVGAAGVSGEWPAGVRRRARQPPSEPVNVRKQKQGAKGRGSRGRVEAAYGSPPRHGNAGPSLELSPSASTLPPIGQSPSASSLAFRDAPSPR